MKTTKNILFYLMVLLSTGLISCFKDDDVVQSITVSGLELHAGFITDGERTSWVSPAAPDLEVSLADFGLEVEITEWEDDGADISGANTFLSVNTIVEFTITSDSIVMMTEDSIFLPGEDLSALFMTDRLERVTGFFGQSRFEPRFSVDYMIGKSLRIDPMIFQLVAPLERDLNQTFFVDISMNDGDEYSLQSNRVRVTR